MKILVAVDGSTYSAAAAKFVRGLPTPEPAEVRLVTVINPPDVALSTSTEMWYPQYIEHQQEYAEETLQAVAETFRDSEVSVDRRIAQGHIGHAIVDEAQQMGADLVVVGAKGHTAIGRIVLGSVSDYVATHAACSVVVIRPRESGNDDVRHRVVIAYDGTPPSETAVQEFAALNWSDLEEVRVLTASPKLEVFREDILSSILEEAARRRTEARRTAEAGAATLADRGWKVSHDSIEVEHVGEGLLEAADAFGGDLIVVGDAQRGRLTRWLMGSTSRYVLRHAGQSVWIARHPREA